MLDRTLAPVTEPIASLDLPAVEVINLNAGSRLHCLYNNQQPIIKFELVFKAGKWFEPQPGVSYFTAKMLLEGTSNLSAKQIADTIALYGASLETNQGYDRATITLYCLSKYFTKLLPLIKEILSESIFPEQELSILKTRTLQNISIEKEKTSYLATQELTRIIYGLNHPYTAGMDEENIHSVTRKSIIEFFVNSYTLNDSEIFLSGDFTKADVDIVNTTFTEDRSILITPLNKTTNISIQKLSSIVKDEKLQTSIHLGRTFPLMNHPDYPGLALLNKILGGYFGSRLMKNIREEKGFTYGISSAISPKEHDTLFYIGTDVKAENTIETISEIKKEISILKNELVTAEELDTVKSYTIGKFLNDTSTIFDQSDRYKTIITHQLPINYYSTYISKLTNTTSDEIIELANTYFMDEDLFQVTVGSNI